MSLCSGLVLYIILSPFAVFVWFATFTWLWARSVYYYFLLQFSCGSLHLALLWARSEYYLLLQSLCSLLPSLCFGLVLYVINFLAVFVWFATSHFALGPFYILSPLAVFVWFATPHFALGSFCILSPFAVFVWFATPHFALGSFCRVVLYLHFALGSLYILSPSL